MLSGWIAFGIFVTLLLVLEAAYYTYHVFSRRSREAQKIRERLQDWTTARPTEETTIVKKELWSDIPWLHEWLKNNQKLQAAKKLHRQAAARMSLGTYVLLSAALAVGGMALGSLLGVPPVALIGGGLLAALLPFGVLYRQKTVRMKAFSRQLPEALDLIARALRAGHAFFVGVKIVGEELDRPIGPEFKQTFEEISMGRTVPEALQNLAGRVDSVDVNYFVTAVNVQRETGGNLAEIMESLSRLIRKRFELRAKVQALSAEGKLSAVILFMLPFAIGTLVYVMNPDYLHLLFTDPIGQKMLAAGGLLMVTGAVVTKRMIEIKV